MHTCVHACSWLQNAGHQYHSSVSFRLLNSLSWKETLKTTVAARLTEMLHMEPVEAVLLSDAPAQSLLFSLTSYLEALMENFPLGAECLQEKLVEGEMAGWSCVTQHLYQMVAPLATSFSPPDIIRMCRVPDLQCRYRKVCEWMSRCNTVYNICAL